MSAARIVALVLAASAVATPAGLAIQRLALLEYEDGPSLTPGYEYLPGETVWLTCRVTGFVRAEKDKETGEEGARLSWNIRATDSAGLLLEPPKLGIIEETLRSEDKDWVPKMSLSFTIPPFAPRGTYRIPVIVKDDLGKTQVSGQLEFRVRGEDAPPANAPLSYRNFRFLAREDDRAALRPAVYKQGAGLFARFDIIGYKFEGNNRFAVEYGLAIKGPPNAEGESKQMFTQETAASQSEEAFYPQRWVPAGFGLNLDPDIAMGDYTLIVTLRDKIGGASQEFRENFRVQ
ncbi:MAG: hypothetical protein ABI995_11135 [Acidobacteriota bacterium]